MRKDTKEWQNKAKPKQTKRPGRGLITNAALKAAGPPFVKAMVCCLARVSHAGRPMDWRGGNMLPGQWKQHLPLGASNAHGLRCASKMGQLYSTTIRAATIPYVFRMLGQDQHGARAHGGTELIILLRMLFVQWATAKGFSAGALFCDLRKAVESVLPEAAVGPLLYHDERGPSVLTIAI